MAAVDLRLRSPPMVPAMQAEISDLAVDYTNTLLASCSEDSVGHARSQWPLRKAQTTAVADT